MVVVVVIIVDVVVDIEVPVVVVVLVVVASTGKPNILLHSFALSIFPQSGSHHVGCEAGSKSKRDHC